MDFKPIHSVVVPLSEVWAVYLFGSQAKGLATLESDLDLAILFDPRTSPSRVWDLRLEFAAELSISIARELDVIVMGEDLDLTFRVLREGQRIYTKQHDEVCNREAELASFYYDFKPFLDRYYKKVAERFKAVG